MRWSLKCQNPDAGTKAENVFGKGTKVAGDIEARGDVCIKGEISGDVITDADIIVCASADIHGSISGRSVTVAGIVQGDIRAVGQLRIQPSGRVWGDVQVLSLRVVPGGLLRGVCEMLESNPETSL